MTQEGTVSTIRDVRLRIAYLVVTAAVVVVVGNLAVVAPTGTVAAAAARTAEDWCILCAGDLPVPVVPLSADMLGSLASEHSRFNAEQLERLDSLLQSEHFGPVKSKTARREAHLLARITTINAYRDLVSLATDSTCVYEANQAAFEEVHRLYSDATLFSTVRLERIRLGLGRVCMRYRLDEAGRGETRHGGRVLRWRVKYKEIDGRKRHLLNLDLPTGTDDVVEVFLAPHHSFAVEYARMEGPPAPYEWFLVHDIQGSWLRKYGTHKPAAYMFWVTPMENVTSAQAGRPSGAGAPTLVMDLPATPLVGVRIYIPGLRLRLPLLPDLNFDDLREIELPMPVLKVDDLRQSRYPHWLGTSRDLGFKNWEGWGPVPPDIRLRFPE